MLIYKSGDLLKSDCTVVMHQANCQKTMGAGIAKAISKMYPGAYLVDKNSNLSPEERFGTFTHYTSKDNGVTVVNLYGQLHFGRGGNFTNYDKLESAIDSFLSYAKDNKNPWYSTLRRVKILNGKCRIYFLKHFAKYVYW